MSDHDSNPYKSNWISKMLARNVKPKIHSVYEYQNESDVLKSEVEMISFLKSNNIKLANILPGGNKPPHKFGEAHNQAKLNMTKVSEIRRLFFDEKYNRVQLAAQFNVSVTNIKDIIRYKIWNKDVDIPADLFERIEKRNQEEHELFHMDRHGKNHPCFGKKASEETKKRLSLSHIGQISHNKGKKMSPEACEKNRLAHLGKPSGGKGIKRSPEFREKCRQRQLGTKQSEETIKKRFLNSRGEGNSSAKLTAQQVLQIRELYSAGIHTYLQLAQQFHVDKSTIYLIVKRKNWANI